MLVQERRTEEYEGMLEQELRRLTGEDGEGQQVLGGTRGAHTKREEARSNVWPGVPTGDFSNYSK